MFVVHGKKGISRMDHLYSLPNTLLRTPHHLPHASSLLQIPRIGVYSPLVATGQQGLFAGKRLLAGGLCVGDHPYSHSHPDRSCAYCPVPRIIKVVGVHFSK